MGCTFYHGLHKDEKFSFLGFFQFLVYRREMGDKKREIDFLLFLSIFCQIFVIFDDFSKFHNVFSSFHFKKCQKFGKKWRKALSRNFYLPKIWNFQQNWLRKMQFWRIFFLFFAKNRRKFFVFREKWKCEKIANHM